MNDAGRIGFLIKGDYVATDTYEFLDVVYYNGSSYVAKKTTIGNAPAEDNEYWHIFAKGSLSPVIGVKGDAEEEYREGYVNITSDDVGALGKDGDSAENTITFESGDTADPAVWADMEVMESGEKHGGLFRKLSLAVRNIRWLKKFTEKLNTDLSKAITTDTIEQQSVKHAETASSLDSNAGNAEQPVYFTDGKPRACNLNPLYYNRSNGALSTKVDGTEYAVPFSGGSNYKVTGLEISRSLSNGKRVLLVTWYADGSTYHNTITCDQD